MDGAVKAAIAEFKAFGGTHLACCAAVNLSETINYKAAVRLAYKCTPNPGKGVEESYLKQS
ncbi:hypothetical protein TUM17387_24420 [Shewanella carassii]|nr:hypothetical protein TUM17387_24420 [Shewanella carassii]